MNKNELCLSHSGRLFKECGQEIHRCKIGKGQRRAQVMRDPPAKRKWEKTKTTVKVTKHGS